MDALFWLQCLEVALIASVKFLFAPFEAERHGFNWIEAFIATTAGGLAGIVLFSFLGTQLVRGWRRFTNLFRRAGNKKVPKTTKFNTRNRFIIIVRRKFGLAGIAFITPCIISIPIGTMIASGLYPQRWVVLRYLFVSLILWSVVLNSLAQFLNLSGLFEKIS